MRELKRDFEVRVIVVLVDVEDCNAPLLQINHLACLSDFTTLLAWSPQEAARYVPPKRSDSWNIVKSWP